METKQKKAPSRSATKSASGQKRRTAAATKTAKKPVSIAVDDLEAYLCSIQQQDSAMYIALHADQDIPYRDIVNVLDIANQHKMKIVLATKK